jgi:hypothetical protein
MKQEIESLKRQLKFYKDKLQLEVNVKKTIQAAKKNLKQSNLNTINYEETAKNEKESAKPDQKHFNSNKNLKSAGMENGKINQIEITVNKFKNDDERLSESSKKGRKSVLSEDIDEIIFNNEEKEKTKSNVPTKYLRSNSPNKILNLNLPSNSYNAGKKNNLLKVIHKNDGKEVKLSTSVQKKNMDQSKDKTNSVDIKRSK